VLMLVASCYNTNPDARSIWLNVISQKCEEARSR
jgi:hypothetical protein